MMLRDGGAAMRPYCQSENASASQFDKRSPVLPPTLVSEETMPSRPSELDNTETHSLRGRHALAV
jgi:hypothetical protein